MAEVVEAELAGASAGNVFAPAPDGAAVFANASLPTQMTATATAMATATATDESAEHAFPLLQNNADADSDRLPTGSFLQGRQKGVMDDKDEDDDAFARPFYRSTSPTPVARNGRVKKTVSVDDDDEDEDEEQDYRPGHDASHAASHETVDGGQDKRGNHQKPAQKKRNKSRVMRKTHKFSVHGTVSLYETASRFYMVGGDVPEKRFRILKIDRTAVDAESSELSMTDDKIIYSQKEMNQLLDTIDDGNKGTGGLKLRCTTWGLLGFIKFTGPWYMLLITKKSMVALLGGHYIYQIEGTEMIPLTPRGFKLDPRNSGEETRFLNILNNLDLTRSFYYSYSYDMTRTLQHNMMREREALVKGQPCGPDDDLNTMFVWNNHLLQPVAKVLSAPYDWCRPVIHGYVDQASLSIYGRSAHITIIARRSRYFAGARFLKRGANDLGYVANDVETEQIVSEALTTSFHAPGPKFFASPTYTSYVQHRGSIPLYWTQEIVGVTPKPPIELNLIDPFYTAAALHFDNLFERYGGPVYALNLIKGRERTARESKLLDEYTKAIAYLNQFLPDGKKIIYRAWDMSRAAKSRDQDVISTLEIIAEDVLRTTGFFHNGDGHTSPIRVQNGVARTNCIDCLDRTNAAQFVIGKRALGHQLHALGILDDTAVAYDTDAVNLFTHMFHDHGDTIAVQYGGSQLVNTMETYRKINQWTSHSRDMVESFKRYYNNSFLDGQRQEAYNLFLGNYIFAQGQPMLWDLATDYYLHHSDPRTWLAKRARHYIHWFTPAFLEARALPPYPPMRKNEARLKPVSSVDDYWVEYYRPSTLSTLSKMFAYKMNSTIKYIPLKATQEGRYDLSPFRVRVEPDGEAHGRKTKKERDVAVVGPPSMGMARLGHGLYAAQPDSPPPPYEKVNRGISLQRWLQPSTSEKSPAAGGGTGALNVVGMKTGGRAAAAAAATAAAAAAAAAAADVNGKMPAQTRMSTASARTLDTDVTPTKTKASALEKTRAAQWTLPQVVQQSLNPTVSAAEAADYARWVRHPRNLALVVPSGPVSPSAFLDDEDMIYAAAEYHEYLHGAWQSGVGLLATATTAGAGAVPTGRDEYEQGQQSQHEEYAGYADLLRLGENPLTVTEGDALKKRYKAYRKWIGGKSFFKQQPVD